MRSTDHLAREENAISEFPNLREKSRDVSFRKQTLFHLNRALVVTAKVYGTGNYCSSNNFICCERNREATRCGLYTMCRSSASLSKDVFEAWRDMQAVDCVFITVTPAQNNNTLGSQNLLRRCLNN